MLEKDLEVLSDQKLIPGLTKISLPFCEYYVTSKQHRLKFNSSTAKSKVISLGGARYFVSFIDDYSMRC